MQAADIVNKNEKKL